ncbi:MAG: hypothetical protein V1674_06390 [Candidatus Omnitrophota bacterium]
MRPAKNPKYKFDVKKIDPGHVEKKEKDLSVSELYLEMLRSKSRHKRR